MKTPHELACAISALINSRPGSPTVAELEGLIRQHWEAPSSDGAIPAPDARAISMTGVAASLKPPMVVVTERIRDSICLGGVAYERGVAFGNWLPPRWLLPASGDCE